jgi:quinol-cytochrome oxidoreductase complex cytochrome b subunit
VRRIWRSAFRGPGIPRTDRDRAWVTFNTLLLHLRPIRLPARTLPFTHTFGLGGSGLVLFLLLTVTGALKMLVYQPAAGAAYDSVLALEREVLFGGLVRGVHYWSANLLIVIVLLHTARVLLTGGFHGARQFNWVIGCALLACVLAFNFTGYLLPWDQLSYWAVTIVTAMLGYVPAIGGALERIARGGPELGTGTIVLFYTLHTTILPVTILFLMALHFWRVRKAGGVVSPPAPAGEDEGDGEKVLFLPNLLLREVALAAVLTALVFVLAALFGAPLGAPANPGMSPNPAKAPWYFVGFQELLIHFHPTFAVLVIPLLGAAALLLLPYLTRDDEPAGRWFLSERGRRLTSAAALLGVTVTPVAVLLDTLIGGAAQGVAGLPGWLTGGVLPFALLLGCVVGFHRTLRRRHGASVNEAAQATAVLLAVAFAVLTLIGVYFRGAGMALAWPWRT